jgi:hypothetical protein
MRRWPAAKVTWFAPLLFDHGASLVVARPPERTRTPIPLPGANLFRHDLWRVDASGREQFAGRLTGFPTCVQPRADADGYCLANEGRRSSLWRVDARVVERVARLSDPVGNPTITNGRWLATTWTDAGFVILDLAEGRGLRIRVSDSSTAREAVETRAGIIALVQTYDGARSRSSVVRYTVQAPSPRMAVPASRSSRSIPRG